jgi:outer membrane receptor protein involved in Fe transport
LVYQASETTVLKALYGKSFREPLVFELSSNLNIQPMEIDSYELGWHQYLMDRSFKNEAVVFFNEAKDLIVSDDVTAIANQGQLKSRGFEDVFHFQYQAIIGFLNYTYMDKVETEERGITEAVYDIPRHKINLALTYALNEDTSLGIVGRYRSQVDTEYQDQIYTLDDYLAWDLTLRTERISSWLGQDASLALIAKNVFDKTYYHPEPRDANALQHPQEGRSFWLRLELAW